MLGQVSRGERRRAAGGIEFAVNDPVCAEHDRLGGPGGLAIRVSCGNAKRSEKKAQCSLLLRRELRGSRRLCFIKVPVRRGQLPGALASAAASAGFIDCKLGNH